MCVEGGFSQILSQILVVLPHHLSILCMHIRKMPFVFTIANGHKCIKKDITYARYTSSKFFDKLISQEGDLVEIYGSTNLLNHLKSTYNEVYKECQQIHTEHQEKEKLLSIHKQLSLMEVQGRGYYVMLKHDKFTSP